jgi:elongator complex protein 2
MDRTIDQSPCRLIHHGVAAASNRNVIAWVPRPPQDDPDSTEDERIPSSSYLAYASHAMLNLAQNVTVELANGAIESCWNVQTTLRTSKIDVSKGNEISCITFLPPPKDYDGLTMSTISCGFSNGSVSIWRKIDGCAWEESVVKRGEAKDRSVTDIDGLWLSKSRFVVVSASSAGATCFTCSLESPEHRLEPHSHALAETSVSVVKTRLEQVDGAIWILLGSAAPKHNKIQVYILPLSSETLQPPYYAGGLSGHEDWITALDWTHRTSTSIVLASGSQDARIRLWKFTTTETGTSGFNAFQGDAVQSADMHGEEVIDDFEELPPHEDENEDGESRLDIFHGNHVSSVTLEALLYGHEEAVTSVSWHPNPSTIYGQEHVLISSSMDRSILFWAPSEGCGIWTPLTRVGSAGGILGGSVGSTLLGYCHASLDPSGTSQTLVGHAYGGAIHVWSGNCEELSNTSKKALAELSTEARTALVKWRATPCITGHFNGVTDLSWEASRGDYLLTTSQDQTCRLWAPVRKAGKKECIWVELARPQVHGYDLSTVTSLSTHMHPHWIATGADEKEIRVFDAPRTTTRILEAATGLANDTSGAATERADRAYIPSLGLSNKASAAEGAEEDIGEDEKGVLEQLSINRMRLPMERDLGAVSLWPESSKLFGHNTELYCMTSTLAARTHPEASRSGEDMLVASSCKARDPESAAIRLWKVVENECVQRLYGHKATVATLSFSCCGRYLISAGKDRRLCVWKKELDGEFSLSFAKDAAHKRIIWSVDCCPFDESFFASGSRDGCVKIWKILDGDSLDVQEFSSLNPAFHYEGKPDSVTALAFAPISVRDISTGLLAVGLEAGLIELWSVPLERAGGTTASPTLYQSFDPSICHVATVTKLAWRPLRSMQESTLLLASASSDHGCRLFTVRRQ